jgi:hypothetical protein
MSTNIHCRAGGDVTGLEAALELAPLLVVGTGPESALTGHRSLLDV